MINTAPISNSHVPDAFPDRIKWASVFDANLLQQDVKALVPHLPQREYIYYNVVPLRGPVGDVKSDSQDPSPSMETDYSDPKRFKWGDYSLMEHCPYIREIIQSFETDSTSVRLMRLEAGAVVKEHTDPTLDAAHRRVIRLTLPIFSNEAVTFLLNDTPVPMLPGEAWYLRLSDPHAVYNDSPEERINLSIDLVYNDWLEGKLTALV